MKILFIALITIKAIAGVPHQDLIVDIMRENFRSATPRLIEYDIKLDQTWKCVYYNSRADIVPNFTNYRDLFNFKRTADWSYKNTESFGFKNFDFHDEGHFIGVKDNFRLYARKIKEGTLIFEYAGPQFKRHKSYISISNNKLSAHAYIYCKSQK